MVDWKKFPNYFKFYLIFPADLWIPWPAATPENAQKIKNDLFLKNLNFDKLIYDLIWLLYIYYIHFIV